jgi:hypothetical protein
MKKIDQEILNKLRQPLHITYISDYIVKCGMDETKKIISEYLKNDLIEESQYGKDYYVIKQKK